jgi:protein-tyrosine phosphatase
MDADNLENLQRLAPKGSSTHCGLLRAFDPAAPPGASVPDPYFGGDQGFDDVLSQCLRACRGLLAKIREEHGL